MTSLSDGPVEVRFVSLPVPLWARSSAHHEAIQREFDILRGSLPEGTVPHRLHEFIETLNLRYGDSRDPSWQSLHDAAERGVESIDLVVKLPGSVAGVVRELSSILDEVDEFCREGDSLLTLATPADQVEFRRWFLGEMDRQIEHGLPPLGWPSRRHGPLEAGGSAIGTRPNGSGVGATISFDGELDLVTAAGLQRRIQEGRAAGDSLTLDLTGVTFIDSVGLSLLMSVYNRVAEEGGSLRLVLPSRLATLFDLSGLTEIFSPQFVD